MCRPAWPCGPTAPWCLPIGDSMPDSPRPMPTALTYIYIYIDGYVPTAAGGRAALARPPRRVAPRARRAAAVHRRAGAYATDAPRGTHGVLTGYSRGTHGGTRRMFQGDSTGEPAHVGTHASGPLTRRAAAAHRLVWSCAGFKPWSGVCAFMCPRGWVCLRSPPPARVVVTLARVRHGAYVCTRRALDRLATRARRVIDACSARARRALGA
jgi:hypothetical protein